MTSYCTCETPVMDVEHDAGCRRCGLPVDFSPATSDNVQEMTDSELRDALSHVTSRPRRERQIRREIAERGGETDTVDPLNEIRAKILSIIALNPHTYESLRSYQNAVKCERELVAAEVAATREP